MKNVVDRDIAKALFKAFGLRYRPLNSYTLRISPEESSIMFDWFHTTGSLVTHKGGYPHRNGKKYLDPEELSEHITRYVYGKKQSKHLL